MMRAALVSRFGRVNEVISVGEYPKPVLDSKARQAKPRLMLIKVLACSISPGDTRTIDGSVSLLRTPKSWPYVPGHDVCGVVEDIDPADPACEFIKAGDCIVATSSKIMMKDGLAEFALVESATAAVKPDNVSAEHAATLGTSAQRALQAVRNAKVSQGERVLVLGGSGGFGTFLIQLLKARGATVVATSTQAELLKSIGADQVIDYREHDVFAMDDFTDSFDVIFDCCPARVNGVIPWHACGKIAKPASKGGRFVAVTMDNPNMVIKSWPQMLGLGLSPAWRTVQSRLFTSSSKPRFGMLAFSQSREDLAEVLRLVSSDELRVVMDRDPLPFTDEGVRTAFQVVADKHAHGKIVVKVQDP